MDFVIPLEPKSSIQVEIQNQSTFHPGGNYNTRSEMICKTYNIFPAAWNNWHILKIALPRGSENLQFVRPPGPPVEFINVKDGVVSHMYN